MYTWIPRNKISVLFGLASSLLAASAMAQLTTQTTTQTTQTADSTMQMGTQLIDQFALASQVVSLSDPSSTQEELPGLGHKFELLGTMIRDTDPENSVGNPGASGGGVGGNEAISAIVPGMAFALRNTPPGVKITAFTNQLGFKHYFVSPKTCQAGSPRITLLVDANGDGQFDQSTGDFAAHGHVQPFVGCVMDKWFYQDLTDDLARWEVTPGGAVPGITAFVTPWKAFAAAVTAAFPNHKVLQGFLIDGESCTFGFGPLNCGKAYYDLVTIENRTLEIWQDTVKKSQ